MVEGYDGENPWKPIPKERGRIENIVLLYCVKKRKEGCEPCSSCREVDRHEHQPSEDELRPPGDSPRPCCSLRSIGP